jgi:hypothetical protein
MTFYLHKVFFSCKILLLVRATSDPDPDRHWFGSLVPDPLSANRLDPDPDLH